MSLNKILEEALGLRKRGRRSEATEILLGQKELIKQHGAAAGLLATIYWEQEDWHRAAKWFEVATKLSPLSERASLGLFHSLWVLGKLDEAFDEMRRFLLLNKSREYVRLLREMGSESRDKGKMLLDPSQLVLEERMDVNAAEQAGLEWRSSKKLTRWSPGGLQHA